MKLHFTSIIFTFFLSLTIARADDFDIIAQRFYDKALYNPTKAQVDAVKALLNSNGSFSDLNYSNSTPDLTIHLTRIYTLAAAYQSIGNTYYQNATIKSNYFSSLQYWVSTNHTPSNWWFREIGYPKTLGLSFILMNAELKSENITLFNNTVTYLRFAYLNNKNMEGANGADKITGALPASVVTKNTAEMTKYTSQITSLIVIQNIGQGIEQDYLFAAHSIDGRQVYGNYCTEYMQSIVNYINFVKGTFCDVPTSTYTILEDLNIEGIQWYMYKQHIDPNQTGRKTSSIKGVDVIANNTKMLADLKSPRTALVYEAYDRIKNGDKAANILSGNRMFWRFDYMIHRRKNYFISSRMISTRTCGLESGDGEGNNNYYGGSGLNFIFRTGKEYEGNYFTIFNYRQFPGITVEQDNATLPLVDWSEGGAGGNNFAGGVSDGTYGAAGMIHSRRNVTARKSWFYFENEFVALGSGITQTNGTANVFTTLNQSLQKGVITYSKNNTQQNITTGSGSTVSSNPDWVFQDSIAYINLDPTSSFKLSSDTRSGTNIFTVGVDHGKNPSNASYSYIIYPNTSASTVNSYKGNHPIQILSNTNTLQAVYHKTLKITQALFYSEGSLTLANGKVIAVNIPSAVMIKEVSNGYEITVANPLCEKSNPTSLALTINTQLSGSGVTWNGTLSTLIFALPQGNFAGQSTKKSVSIIVSTNLLPIVAITSPVNSSSFTSPANIAINANASDSDGAVTKVDFYNGVVFIGSDNTSPYSFVWSNIATGTYSISAKATDNSGGVAYSTTVPITVVTPVNQLPAVNITSPANNTSFNAPTSITINASASDSDGSVTKVDFYNGPTLIGTDNTSPYSVAWLNVVAGTYSITTKATDNSGAVSTSSIVSIFVTNPINQLPTVSITSPASNATYNAPVSITINANASDSDGSVSKVEFYNGTIFIGSDNTSPYSFVWNSISEGTYSISTKVTDNSGGITYSSIITVKVNAVSTNLCSTIPIFSENNGYVTGSIVQNSGSRYQCKPYPYTGWCNGAAWAYAPGTGAYWQDAWSLIGSCSSANPTITSTKSALITTAENLIVPNPATDVVSINISEKSNITLYNNIGEVVMSTTLIEPNGTINLSHLPAGMYLVKIDTGVDVLVKTLIKI